jgi:hypothetical protein
MRRQFLGGLVDQRLLVFVAIRAVGSLVDRGFVTVWGLADRNLLTIGAFARTASSRDLSR